MVKCLLFPLLSLLLFMPVAAAGGSAGSSCERSAALSMKATLLLASGGSRNEALSLYEQSLHLHDSPEIRWRCELLRAQIAKEPLRRQTQQQRKKQRAERSREEEKKGPPLPTENGVYRPPDFGIMVENILTRCSIRRLPRPKYKITMHNFDRYQVKFAGVNTLIDTLTLMFSVVDETRVRVNVTIDPGAESPLLEDGRSTLAVGSAEAELLWNDGLHAFTRMRAEIKNPHLTSSHRVFSCDRIIVDIERIADSDTCSLKVNMQATTAGIPPKTAAINVPCLKREKNSPKKDPALPDGLRLQHQAKKRESSPSTPRQAAD